MKLFAIVSMENGLPKIDFTATPCTGYALGGKVGGFGCYLFSGTAAQLTALAALANVIAIRQVSDGSVRFPELDATIGAAARTKINNWLTARGYPNIPSGWTYRQVVKEIYKRVEARFDLDHLDVGE